MLGGAAIVLFLAAWVRPYYNSNSFAPYKVDVTLPEDQTLSYFIDQVIAERNESTNNIQFNFGNNEALIPRFRPQPLNQAQTYRGNSWIDVFTKVGDNSPCLKIKVAANTLSFQIDPQKMKKLRQATEPLTRVRLSKKFIVCKVVDLTKHLISVALVFFPEITLPLFVLIGVK